MKNTDGTPREGVSLREQWVDVAVDVDLERQVVRLTEPQGEVHEYVCNTIRTLAAATARNGGLAQWCAKYLQLLVPGGSYGTPGSPFHKLTPARMALPA